MLVLRKEILVYVAFTRDCATNTPKSVRTASPWYALREAWLLKRWVCFMQLCTLLYWRVQSFHDSSQMLRDSFAPFRKPFNAKYRNCQMA